MSAGSPDSRHDVVARPVADLPPGTAARVRLGEFDAARRLGLLRIILPGLFAITLLALPFAIQADLSSTTLNSTLQDGIGLLAFAAGLVAVRRRSANIAALMLFAGVSGVIVVLTLQDGPLQGALDLTAVPEFALFTLPIVIAGIFGRGRTVALATGATVVYTLAILLLTPHTRALAAVLAQDGGLAVFTVPIACQLALGTLMLGATRAVQRTQRELYDVRTAYEREKELDRLKDQFIASVNHELRTPIMALQGYIEIAREQLRGPVPEQQQHTLERAAGAAEHLAGIVRSVLDVRRVEAIGDPHPEVISLRQAVVAAAQLLDPLEAGGVARDLTLRVPEELVVYADEMRVRQVLVNLLSNAAKYSPPGSPIEVSARLVAAGHRRRGEAAREVEVAVCDRGLGVPPEKAPLLFERFVRLERDIASPTPGTGLGLALCRAYVTAMGGRIWIESAGIPGEGTIVSFTLPSAPAA